MIDFEHGALRRKGEPVLAGTIAHGVMDHRDARAFSFLNAAAVLELEQWSTIIDAEKERRLLHRKDLERAVRRLRVLILDSAASPLLERLNGYAIEIAWRLRVETHVPQRTYGAILGMLTAATFAILYGERIGGRELTLIHAPFEPFIPLESLG